MTSRQITRRRFLLLGGGTTLSAFMGGAYLKGGCPLSNSGVCVGPCAAFIDRNHDQICDRIQNLQALTQDPAPSTAHQPHIVASCPFGLVNDPYPGQCAHYVDRDGNGICDLSEMVGESDSEPTQAPAEAAQAQTRPTPAPTRRVACPFGLVNDPFPGKCRRYVDRDGNGICDLSEIVEQAAPEPTCAPAEDPASAELSAPTPTPQAAQVSVACPFGLVNDPYPGKCRRYVDRDGNGICDLSEILDEVPSQEAEQVAPETGKRQRGQGKHRGSSGS